jgi:fatty-acyl-CoA synthase
VQRSVSNLFKDEFVITTHYAHWPKDQPYGLQYPQTPLTHNFQVSAMRYPDKSCMIFYGSTLTYRQAWRQVESQAAWLIHEGQVERGDRVLLNFQNAPQFILAYYAILLAGGMVVPVNPMSKTEELRYYLEDASCKVAIVAQDIADQIAPLVGEVVPKVVVGFYMDFIAHNCAFELPAFISQPTTIHFGASVISWADTQKRGQSYLSDFPSLGPHDLCVLPYTSGSTGKPKGCIHTHATVNASVQTGLFWRQVNPQNVTLATAPFFHVTGMVNSLHTPLAIGATIVLLPRWDAAVAALLIEQYRCTNWTNVPPMVVDVLTNPKAQGRDLSSLRTINGGGAAMPAAIAQRLKDEYGLSYIEGYGMTEFMAATHSNPAHNPKKQCLGIPVFDAAAHVIDPDSCKPLDANQQGEIVMSCPNMMKGYWKGAHTLQKNNRKNDSDPFFLINDADPFMGGLIEIEGRYYFRSGDLGYRDDDGYYFITDRLKRMINASGFKVWPAEVEGFFYKHPAIKECCIVAAPDPKRGETVRLVAVLKAEHLHTTAEDLIAWARETMATYKAPTEVLFMEALPRTSTGKLYWRLLQDQAFGRT